jgi:hypothetical protein
MKADPLANWEFHQPQMFGNTMMVSCTVTAFGKPVTMHLPVMDHRNKAIENPDAFAVNKNMMRCLVKAIACHGLGLYIYAGEDLPEAPQVTKITPEEVNQETVNKAAAWLKKTIDEDNLEKNWNLVQHGYAKLSNNERMAVDQLLQDKAPNSNRAYKNILKDYLNYVPAEVVQS